MSRSVRDKVSATKPSVYQIFMTVVYTRCLSFVRFIKFDSVTVILHLKSQINSYL